MTQYPGFLRQIIFRLPVFPGGLFHIDRQTFLCIIPHEVRFLEDEIYFHRAAEKLLMLMTESQKKPVHQNARSLSSGEAGILHRLSERQEPMSAGELSRAMDIGSGGVANLLNALEKKGCVCRVTNPRDRRRIMVSLSDTGKQLIEEKKQEALELTAKLLTRLGREDTAELIRIYQKMLEITGDYLQNHCKETV